MIQFIIPVAVLAAKRFGNSLAAEKEDAAIAQGIIDGTREAESELKRLINHHLRAAVINLSVNSALVIAAVLLLPLWLSRGHTLLAIASIYLLSIIHGAYNTLKTLRTCHTIYKSHGFNVKKFVENEIFQRVYEIAFAEAKSQTDNVWHWLFGQKTAADIAGHIARESAVNATALIAEYVLKKTVFVMLMIAVYYLLARMIVIPFLVMQETQMPFWQTLIHPFVFALQYFWGLLAG